MPITFSYFMPVRIEFGNGKAKMIAEELKKYGCKKPFIVTDKGVVNAGLLTGITRILQAEDMTYEVFDKVIGNPTDEIVQEGVDVFAKSGCDSFVAVGGGSSMDSAKAIGIIYKNGGSVREYDCDRPGTHPTPIPMDPLFCIPTTAGTGSEVTPFAVITDTSRHWKMSLFATGNTASHAKVALVDPEMTTSMPGPLAAATGMDALTHAVEAVLSKNANFASDMLNYTAIELIANNLRQSVANGNNVEARGAVLLGNTVAGWGFQQVGLGSVHSLAHILGGQLDVPHGVGNAIMLPYVMEYNILARPEKIAKIAEVMGEKTAKLSTIEAADRAVTCVKRLSKDIGIPCLSEVKGIKEENLPKYAELAIQDGNTANNPRIPTIQDYLALYKKAW